MTLGRHWPLGITVAVLASGVVGVLLTLQTGSVVPLLLPVGLVGVAVIGPRLFSDPVSVISLLLVFIVNCDYFHVVGKISLDVLISSLLLWAILIRNSLDTRKILFQSTAEKLFIAYLVVTFISLLLSVSPLASIKRWGRDFEFLILFSFLLSVPLTTTHFRRLTMATMLSAILPCIIGLLGLWLGIESLLGRNTPISDTVSVPRISSTLPHAVIFALYLGVTSVITLSFLIDGRFFKRRWLLPLFILQVVVLYMTYGRTGWGGFVFGVAALLWLRGRRWVLLIGAPLALIAFSIMLPSFIGRWAVALEDDADANSLIFRIQLWQSALELFPNRPIFGSGPGTFVQYVAFRGGYAPHQTWIGVLVETGIAGMITFVALLAGLFRTMWRRYKLSPPGSDPLLEGVFAVWIGLLGASLTQHTFALPSYGVYVWVLTAIALRDDSIFKPRLINGK